MTPADILENAVGTMVLQRMLYFDPSRATECEKPTSPILAGGSRGGGGGGGGRRWREEGWGEETEEREMRGGDRGKRDAHPRQSLFPRKNECICIYR